MKMWLVVAAALTVTLTSCSDDDDNNTGADRKTTLYVADAEGEITEIPVTQTTFYKGEALNNGNGQWFQANGLGYGMNYQYVLDPTYNRDGQSFALTDEKVKDPIKFDIEEEEKKEEQK